jgi:hypothetical protein
MESATTQVTATNQTVTPVVATVVKAELAPTMQTVGTATYPAAPSMQASTGQGAAEAGQGNGTRGLVDAAPRVNGAAPANTAAPAGSSADAGKGNTSIPNGYVDARASNTSTPGRMDWRTDTGGGGDASSALAALTDGSRAIVGAGADLGTDLELANVVDGTEEALAGEEGPAEGLASLDLNLPAPTADVMPLESTSPVVVGTFLVGDLDGPGMGATDAGAWDGGPGGFVIGLDAVSPPSGAGAREAMFTDRVGISFGQLLSANLSATDAATEQIVGASLGTGPEQEATGVTTEARGTVGDADPWQPKEGSALLSPLLGGCAVLGLWRAGKQFEIEEEERTRRKARIG